MNQPKNNILKNTKEKPYWKLTNKEIENIKKMSDKFNTETKWHTLPNNERIQLCENIFFFG